MDKIFSTRIEESVAKSIEILATRLRTSKKNIIERAVELYAKHVGQDQEVDIFKQAFGAWKRKESASETVKQIKETMRQSITRHHQ